MQFRTDINGLRAYAVLAVIIFHFNSQWLPGGFAGVDVFFVISGYLMTSIIFRGLSSQSFSLRKFYASRVKRIIPALLILVIILMVLGYFLIGPMSYRNLSKESIRSLLFISNFLYWRDSGYFDAGALSKPLLHTWSLSVEWQFYIVYPAILVICAKFLSIKTLKKIILSVTILSFGLATYFSHQSPTAAYFLLPTRMWEMLLGGLVFLYPLNIKKSNYKYLLEFSGIILILLSFFIISENTPWPGYMALIPTIGAFLLIQANGHSLLTRNFIFQKIGLWSYSLYLYHWPLVYLNHRYNLQMHVVTFIILTFLFSLLSYYLIEKRTWKVKTILITLLIILIPTYGVYKTKGAEFRVPGKNGLTADQMYGGGLFPQYQEANTSSHKEFDYVMVGDSVARQYANFLVQNNHNIRTFYGDACLFIPNYSVYLANQERKECTDFSQQFYNKFIDETFNKPIIWAQNWDGYTIFAKEKQSQHFSESINQEEYFNIILSDIKAVADRNPQRRFYLVGLYVKPNYNVYECLSAQNLSKFAEICQEFIPYKDVKINHILQKIADQYSNIYFIDPSLAFCNNNGCQMITENQPMFTDLLHLSTYGADIIGKYIFDEIKKIESEEQK